MEIGEPKKFSLEATGLTVQEGITFAEWAEIGKGLFQVHAMSPIWIGDWLNEGEKRFGETYTQAVDITKLSVDTLAHYRSIMGRVPKEVRYPGGTLSHYRAVAALPLEDQKKYLEEAKVSNLSVRDLGALVGARALKIEPPCGGCGEFHPLQIFRLCKTCADQISKKNGE